MLRDLHSAIHRQEKYIEVDFKEAANILLTKQFVYLENSRQARHYRTVVDNLEYFRDLFDALGWQLYVDHDFGYAGVLPNDAETYYPLSTEATLLLFTARLVFEEGVEAHQTREGKVFIEAEDMLMRYEALTRTSTPIRDLLDRKTLGYEAGLSKLRS